MFVKEFEEFLAQETQLKEKTIKDYVATTKRFIETYKDLIEVDLKQALREYLLDNHNQLELSSINTNLTSLKKYITFLVKYHPKSIGDYNLSYFPERRKGEKLPKTINDFQIQQLLLILDNTKLFDPVGQFTLRLLINHGMSPKEITNMRVDNIDFQKGMILYRDEEDNLMRMLVMIKSDFEWLINYLHSPDFDINNPSIIQLKKQTIKTHHIQKYCKELGIKAKMHLNPTILRNTFIRQCLANGMSELYLMLYMGFKNINTVARYQTINFTRLLQNHLPFVNQLRTMIVDSDEKSKETREQIVEIYQEVQSTVIPKNQEAIVDLTSST